MIGFITRMALLSLVGLLINPAGFKAQIPTAAQIAHVTHQINSATKFRRAVLYRVAEIRGDIRQVQGTVKELDVAYHDIHREFVSMGPVKLHEGN